MTGGEAAMNLRRTKRMSKMVTIARLIAGLAAISGCASKSNSCEEVESVVLADDEESPDGSTGAQVLALAGQVEGMPLHWKGGITNAEGDTSLSLSFERTPSSVRFVRTEQVGTAKSDLGCGPQILVPVVVRMTTEDGALDESFESQIVYRTDDGPIAAQSIATIAIDFDYAELVGWLAPVAELDGGGGEITTTVGATVQGQIGVVLDLDDKERYEVAASWGPPP
jgi:hypothetical protein